MKIVFTGGGTGGHVFPLIAVIREIKSLFLQRQLADPENIFEERLPAKAGKKEEKLLLYYLGPKDDFGLVLLSQEGIIAKEIFAGKIRRYFNLKSLLENLVDLFFKTPLGIFQAFYHLFFLAPDLVFSKGGYGSFSVTVCAWFLGIPVFLHESDADPGVTNKLLARFSRKIFVSFLQTEKFPPSKMILTGNPIRKEILGGTKAEAEELFKIMGGKPIVLIFGGSQGSQRINDLVLAILPQLLENFEVLHQTGEKNFEQFKAEAEVTCPEELKGFYHYLPFFREEEYKQALAVADLVVSRASGGAIFEIAAFKKPSVLIPLPESAQNHQLKNAYNFAKTKAAIVMEEANLSPNFFLEKLKDLIARPLELQKMSEAAESFAKIDAAQNIAKYLLDFLKM